MREIVTFGESIGINQHVDLVSDRATGYVLAIILDEIVGLGHGHGAAVVLEEFEQTGRPVGNVQVVGGGVNLVVGPDRVGGDDGRPRPRQVRGRRTSRPRRAGSRSPRKASPRH